MDSDESSEGGTFKRLVDEFKDKHPYSKKLLREEMENTLKSQSKKGKGKNAWNLTLKRMTNKRMTNKRIHEQRLARTALPLNIKTVSIPRIPILSRSTFIKRNERRHKTYLRSSEEELKRSVTPEKHFDEFLCSFFKIREKKVPRSEVEGTRSPKIISEKPSAKIAHLQRKVKPKVVAIQQVEDTSKTNKILKIIQEQKELGFETDLNNFSKTSALEINNNEIISKHRGTSYSKSNSTNSVSEKSSTDEFTVFGTETSLKIHQFRPLKNSTLILSSQVDGSVVENMNLETDGSNESKISSENIQKESVDNVSFVTLRKKSGSKNSSLFLSKEDDRIEIKNNEQDSKPNGTNNSNLKIDDANASRISKISSSRIEFSDSDFGKSQQGTESEKISPILSKRKRITSYKKRRMPLEKKATVSEVEISDSEKTTELLDIWNIKQQYGKAYAENIVKRSKRDPGEPVSDSEKTTELLELYLNQFRPLKSSSLTLLNEVNRSVVENMNLGTDECNESRISLENIQKESVDNISFVTLRKKSGPSKNSSIFLSKKDDRIEINNNEQDSKPNGTSYLF